MSELHIGSDSPSDLIRIWRPQAIALGAKARTPDSVGRFLESKGIPKHEASEAAIEIWNEAQKGRLRADLPRVILGWGFIVLGLALTSYTMIWRGGFVFISLGPVALGAAILWGGYLTRGSD